MVNQALRSQTIEDLAAQHFGVELPRQPVNPETGAEEQAIARRAAGEALTALLALPILRRQLEEGGLAQLFDEVEMPLLPVLARMEKAGVKIDLEALGAMSEEFGATLAGLEARIYGLVGHEFNIGSPRQLETILFDELSLPSTKRTRTSRSTDASVLEELRDKHEVIGLILEHRQVSKLKSTYVDALPSLVDARAGCTRPTSRRSRPPAACRARIRTSRTSRSARPSAGASAARSSRRRVACCSAPTTRSRSSASWPTSRATPDSRPTSPRTPTSTSPPRLASWGWRPTRSGRRSAAWRR